MLEIDFRQGNYTFSFEFFKLHTGRYLEHRVGRNWRCDLGVYCTKPDRGISHDSLELRPNSKNGKEEMCMREIL